MKLLFCSSDRGGCAYYRAYLPSKHLCPEYQTSFSDGFPMENGLPGWEVHDADVILLQRHTDERFISWIPLWKSLGKKVIYDLDDSFWHVPGYNPSRINYTKRIRTTTEIIMMLCDAVICSTEPLAQYLRKLHPRVFIAPNMIEEFHAEQPGHDRLRIGWGGSKTHIGDFSSKLVHVLKHCQRKYHAQIVWLGYRFAEIPGDVLIEPEAMPGYLFRLHEANLDISLAPLQENFFNECKSNLKFLEYSSCRFASVLSNSYPYKNTVVHGETGFIVRKKEWDTYIEHLCDDETERKRIGSNAYEYVENNFNWLRNKEKQLAVYRQILGV